MFNFGDVVTFDLDPTNEELTVLSSGAHRTQVVDSTGTHISHATELLTLVQA